MNATDTVLPSGAEYALLSVLYARKRDVLKTLTFGGATWQLEDVEDLKGKRGSYLATYFKL